MDLTKLENLTKENAKGFEYEIFLLKRDTKKISTENGEFEKITSAGDYGLGLRLLKDKKVGFAYTSDLTEESLKALVENLKEITLLMPENPHAVFQTEKGTPLTDSPFDNEGAKIPIEEKIEFVISFERSVMNSHPYIKGTRETTFTENVFEVFFKNSFGVEFSYGGTAYSIVSSALAESPKGDKNITWGYRASRYLKGLDLEDFKRELVQKLIDTLDPQPFESKSLPVLFHREAFAALLETFSDLFSGESLLKNKTPLKGKVGETIAAEGFNLIDDGTLKGGFSTSPFDDEGTIQQKTVLVENGTLKGFFHSLETAKGTNSQPTGNGFRNSFTTPPSAGISNFYLQPVGGNFEELLRSEEEVFVVYDLMGLHTADPISGNFSLGASGALYRNGKKVSAIRGVTVAGNFLELIRNISRIGEDLQFYGNVGSPSVLVKNITIGGK
jgi:PmbA protein